MSGIKQRIDDAHAAKRRAMLQVFGEQSLTAADDGRLQNQRVVERQLVQHMQVERASHQFRRGRHKLEPAVEVQAPSRIKAGGRRSLRSATFTNS